MTGIAGLVLAAGASSRMGIPKQLLSFGQNTLLDHVLAESLRSDLEKIVLVLGFQAEKIRQTLKTNLRHPKLKVIENKDYSQGMSSSLITGLSAVEKDSNAVMVILGDMPYITSKIINFLLYRYEQSCFSLAAVIWEGKRSHPVIIGKSFFSALHGLRGDEGAKALFAKHADRVCLVEPFEEYNGSDVDTWDDYLTLIRKTKR
ncbi:MAG: nucleotidyltransferase family protein [Deltaproteobacteria bacterium]|nr:nucleotidyltransferase family protein [Deltaproteobacteria bacterium]